MLYEVIRMKETSQIFNCPYLICTRVLNDVEELWQLFWKLTVTTIYIFVWHVWSLYRVEIETASRDRVNKVVHMGVKVKEHLPEDTGGVEEAVFEPQVMFGSWAVALPVRAFIVVFLWVHTNFFVRETGFEGVQFAEGFVQWWLQGSWYGLALEKRKVSYWSLCCR